MKVQSPIQFNEETFHLNEIAKNSIYAEGISAVTLRYCCHIFIRYMGGGGTVLELGPAEGLMTDILYPIYSKDYTIVDGSELFVKKIKEKYPSINAFFSTFEEFCPSHKFDNIILGHVLEHVIDPIAILKLCKTWLTKAGKVLAAVPNKNSIHRQAGVKMGLLKSLDDFSDKDKRHGHRRVFGMENFLGCFKEAAFCIEAKGGYWLKPISDAQINQYWTQEMIRAFLILGEELPDIAGEIYCIATN